MIGEADFSMTAMAMNYNEGDSRVDPKDYEDLFVRFSFEPFKNPVKSKEEGRPIFEDTAFVDIRTPGDRTSQIFRPAVHLDKLRWPKHWAAFEAHAEQGDSGTPLEEWPPISRSMVEELKYFNVKTVEDLANLSDSACQGFMGIQGWKTRAKAWLAQAGESAEAEALAGELAKRDSEIEILKQQVAGLVEDAAKSKSAKKDVAAKS